MLEEFNEILETDIQDFKSDNYYLSSMLFVTKELVRETEIPDTHIIDINAKIGMYLDEIEFNDPDEHKKVFAAFSKRIGLYCILLDGMGLDVVRSNYLKLKNYNEDDSIWK